jgi:hypothetical protein
MLRSIVFCDIDGTLVPNHFSGLKQLTKTELRVIRKKIEMLTLSKKVLETLRLMVKNADLVFVTGRPIEWKETTYKLLQPINKNKLYRVYFLNIEGSWTKRKYYDFKLSLVNDLSEKYDIIYVIDDIVNMLKYIKKYFKWEDKSLFLINGVFNSVIENIVINNRLM